MWAISGAARIAYDTTPEVPGRSDVVLIHAGVNDRRSWSPLITRLRDNHRCVAFDGRGYGDTTYSRQDGWSVRDDAVAVMDAAGVERACLVACSMGGETAIEIALDHPERVSGLVLICSAIRGAPYPELTAGPTAELEALIEAADEAGDIDEVNRLEARLWLDGPGSDAGRVGGDARDLFLEMNGRALRAPDPGSGAEAGDTWSRLGEITAPTLVLIGRLDVPSVQAVDQQAAGVIPDARLIWLDGVAHLPHLEADPACLREVVAFVDTGG